MKNTIVDLSRILNNDNTFNIIEGLANSNPNQEVNETTLREAFTGLSELRDLIREAIDKGVLDKISHTSRNVLNNHFYQIERNARTDKCSLYINLIPNEIHHVKRRGINRIERMNLTLRTHLKRLNRRTIAYSKNLLSLSAILKIYFWS